MEDKTWAVLFFILFLGLIVALIVLLATYPYPNYPYYRDASPLKKGDAPGRAANCTASEEYNEELHLCAPVVNIPVPISGDMMG